MTNEVRFFTQLGKRLAALRKSRGLSQQQLAKAVGLSQQIIASYETGERHIPVWRLLTLSEALGAVPEELLSDATATKRKRGPKPLLERRLDAILKLPKKDQALAVQLIDRLLESSNSLTSV